MSLFARITNVFGNDALSNTVARKIEQFVPRHLIGCGVLANVCQNIIFSDTSLGQFHQVIYNTRRQINRVLIPTRLSRALSVLRFRSFEILIK